MQLNDYELDKKLEELEKQRKTLYETASKTDKVAEKEKYRKIKEDLKINQKDIALFTIEKEKREAERILKKVPSQVKEIDYEKQIKQLKKQRKELLETASKTDKNAEKEKYRKIKEDLKQNKIDITLLEESREKAEREKAEQEKQEQEKQEREKGEEKGEQEKGEEQEEKPEEKKRESIEGVNHVLMQLQLGDVIKLHDPINTTLNGYTFFINYIDASKMKLINLSSMTTTVLKINKDMTIEDDTIDVISLLFRNKTPSYARQNKLLPGTWLNILFEGDLPKIETGEITNLEQDMIEIKLFPSNNIIFLNFEYKGMVDNVTLEIRDEIVKDHQLEDQGVQPEEDQGVQPQPEDQEEKEKDAEEKEIEIEALPENITAKLHRIILKANQVEFGKEHFGRITQFIDVDISKQRYSLDAQLNDLMDDLFATVPTIQRKNTAILNAIHTTVERFKQLRQQFSTFD